MFRQRQAGSFSALLWAALDGQSVLHGQRGSTDRVEVLFTLIWPHLGPSLAHGSACAALPTLCLRSGPMSSNSSSFIAVSGPSPFTVEDLEDLNAACHFPPPSPPLPSLPSLPSLPHFCYCEGLASVVQCSIHQLFRSRVPTEGGCICRQ